MNQFEQYHLWVVQVPNRVLLKQFELINKLETFHPIIVEMVEDQVMDRGLIVEGMKC